MSCHPHNKPVSLDSDPHIKAHAAGILAPL